MARLSLSLTREEKGAKMEALHQQLVEGVETLRTW
jgi:hypothetical protein